ncbi:hypothetical protein METP3_01660 [Methanosarcinales archaeon]|nr:hypothetical protein METP3_01660 [Methanosarcinales archaeon]
MKLDKANTTTITHLLLFHNDLTEVKRADLCDLVQTA